MFLIQSLKSISRLQQMKSLCHVYLNLKEIRLDFLCELSANRLPQIITLNSTYAKKSSSSSLNKFSFLSSFRLIAGILGLWTAAFCFRGIPKSRSSKSSQVSDTPPPHRFLPLCFLPTEISNGSWNNTINSLFSGRSYCRIWASSWQNLSLGLLTKQDLNQSPQLQRLARKLNFHL